MFDEQERELTDAEIKKAMGKVLGIGLAVCGIILTFYVACTILK